MRQQWRRQQLELIPITGQTLREQGQQFLRFLDQLADTVTMMAPPLVLAADVPTPQPLHQIRQLLSRTGEEVRALAATDLNDADAHFLAEVLNFLTTHGWRPTGGLSLCALWERLACRTTNPEERRRMLIAALQCAEAFDDASRVRHLLGDEDSASGN
jgi:hypothetical protein